MTSQVPGGTGSSKVTREEEVLFGRILILKGFATAEQVKECLALQAQSPHLRLGELMMRKGYISLDAIEEVVKLKTQAAAISPPPREGDTPKTIRFQDLPAEVNAALQQPKRRFGKYVLLKELGRGGMGQVFKAWDTGLNRMVAIKVLTADTAKEDVQRFFREAQTAASLNHPNIAAVYDMGESDGKHFIAMQFIDGKTLQGMKLSPRRSAEIIRTVAEALEVAHRAGIIHRDLKPQNIMVDANSRPFLMDFGIARSLVGKSGVTAAGTVVGTPSYMSPEQAQGKTLTSRTDVYSLGATLYEMLCGRPPFKAATPVETLMHVLNREAPRPSTLARGVPADLEQIALKCMEKDPKARYASVRALAEDLGRFIAGEPVLAKPPSAASRLKRTLKKNRVAIPIAAGLALAAIAVIVILGSMAGDTGKLMETLAKADARYQDGKYEEALALYNQAKALDPGHSKVLSQIEACRKKIDFAKEMAKRDAEEAERKRREAEAKRREEEAKRREEEAKRREEEAKRREAEAQLARRAEVAPELEKGKQKLISQAERDLYRPRADLTDSRRKALEAIVHFDAVLAKVPEHEEALYYRGRARLLRLEYDVAERDFGAAIAARSDYVPARLARGRMNMNRWMELFLDAGGGWYLRSGAGHAEAERLLSGAKADFEAALKAGEGEKPALFEAHLALASNNPQSAVDHCTRALAANDTDEEAWKLMGDALYFGAGVDAFAPVTDEGMKTLERAASAYSKAIDLRVNYPEALAMRGTSLVKLGRNDLAVNDYRAALAIDRSSVIAMNLLASLLSESGHPEEAVTLYTEVLRLRPNSFWAHVNRAASLGKLDRQAEALLDAERAVELMPKHVFAWQIKGAVLGRLMRWAEADEALTRGIEIDPTLAVLWYNRGATRLNMKRRAEGIADLEEAIRRGHPQSDYIRKLIDSLRSQ